MEEGRREGGRSRSRMGGERVVKELSPYKKREPNRGKLVAQRRSPEVGERPGFLSSQMRWKQWVWQKGLQLEMVAAIQSM